MSWSAGAKRWTKPAGWDATRQQVKARAGEQCERVTGGIRCPNPGTDCNHKPGTTPPRDGASADPASLEWLCPSHHAEITQAQARAGAAAKADRLKHPGAR